MTRAAWESPPDSAFSGPALAFTLAHLEKLRLPSRSAPITKRMPPRTRDRLCHVDREFSKTDELMNSLLSRSYSTMRFIGTNLVKHLSQSRPLFVDPSSNPFCKIFGV